MTDDREASIPDQADDRGRAFVAGLVEESGIMDAPLAGQRWQMESLAGAKRTKVDWLLPDIPIPLGTIAALAGQQNIGKGMLTVWWAARLTQAGHGVAFAADEDGVETTLVPRLQAVGADMTRVFRFTPIDREEVGGVLLPRDTREVAALAEDNGVRALLLDPWTDHVIGNIDKGGDVREALMSLARVCQETMLTTIITAHPVKEDRGDPLTCIAHASAVTQVIRSAFYMTVDPDAESGALDTRGPARLVCHVKNNQTRRVDTARYEIETVLLPAEDGQPEMEMARVVDAGTSELTWLDVVARQRRARRASSGGPTMQDKAEAWLREHLADGDARLIADVMAAGIEAGHADRTLRRAAGAIGLRPEREPGENASAPGRWRLPADQDEGDGE